MVKHKNTTDGQGLVEYALILVLVVIAVVIVLTVTGNSVSDVYCSVLRGLGSDSETCGAASSAYCDDGFNNLSDWEFVRSGEDKWHTQGGQMCMTADSYRDYAYSTCSKDLPVDDYVIHLTGAELSQGPGYGVFFRLQEYDDTPTGYAFQYDKGSSGFVFRRWTNGTEKTIAYRKMGSDYNWYDVSRDIEIRVKGSEFKAYVDGEWVLTATDSAYSSGGAGFRTWWDTNVCFDSMDISAALAEE